MSATLEIDLAEAGDLAILDQFDNLHEQIEAYGRLRELLHAQVERLLAAVLGYPAWGSRLWRQCRDAVYAGRVEEVQASRERVLAHFRKRLDLLRYANRVAEGAGNLTGRAIGRCDELSMAIAAMERLATRVFDRWVTKEDLEDLAAQDYPMPAEKLKALAKKYPPPQAWYDEEFTPA